MMNEIEQRLNALRHLMQQHQVDFYFVPSSDQHHNEYPPKAWERRAFISGFTGSAGDVLVGLDQAYLWTDPRYFLQAQQQLNPAYFTLMKQQQGLSAPLTDWLKHHAPGKKVGVDPKLMPLSQFELWQSILQSVGSELICIESNLIDSIWTEQPALLHQPLEIWDTLYAGQSAAEKIAQLQAILRQSQSDAHVLTTLDAIMWLYNVRGQDVDYNPLALSHALVTLQGAYLYIHLDQVTPEVQQQLHTQGIVVKPESEFVADCQNQTGQVWLDPNLTNQWVASQFQHATLYHADSPITLLKAIKNEMECAGMQEAHRQDGLALCRFFYDLEKNGVGQTELDLEEKLIAFRQAQPDYRGLSFSSIVGYKEHGAIIHYKASAKTNCTIGQEALLLIDSGGQYVCGTTDITRTVHLGQPTPLECYHYTLVLKGHLALRHTVFPHGTTGEQLNAIAHRPLWNAALEFGHGTGHGVGCYLCVHEGPQRISSTYTRVPLVPGMVVSNEPGVYLEGQYGIRIENLCVIIQILERGETGHGPFYTFHDLTLVPYARNLIDTSLLSSEEISWINAYHQRVYDNLHPELEPEVVDWLKQATEPLSAASF